MCVCVDGCVCVYKYTKYIYILDMDIYGFNVYIKVISTFTIVSRWTLITNNNEEYSIETNEDWQETMKTNSYRYLMVLLTLL